MITGLGTDDLRALEVRGGIGRLTELRRELAEREVLAASFDQPEGGGIPKECRPAVAEQDLISRRQ